MAQDRTPPDPNRGSLPDWLSGMSSDDPDSNQSAPAPVGPSSTSNDQGETIPDWFTALESDIEGRQSENTSTLPHGGSSAIEASEAFPDWFSATEGSSAGALPTAESEMPDLDALIGNAPAAPSQPSTPDTLSPPSGPLALPEQARRSLRERINNPQPIPPSAAEQSMPEWMRELGPEETSSTPVPAPSLPVTKNLPPIPPPRAPMTPKAVKPAEPKPPPVPAEPRGDSVLLGGDISSADIDALINLPIETYGPPEIDPLPPITDTSTLFDSYSTDMAPASPTSISGPFSDPGQSANELLTLDDAALDRLLGPIEPAVPTRMMGAAASAVPLSASGAFTPDDSTSRRNLLDRERPAIQADELPDFVADMRPDDAPIQLSVAGMDVDVDEAPASELDPSLQQLRERSRATQQFRPSAKSSVGPLAEIEGTLVAEPVLIRAVVNASGSPRVTNSDAVPTPDQLAHVDILKRLLDVEEAEHSDTAIGTTTRSRPRIRIDFERYLVTLILLVALLVPFFTDKLNLAPAPEVAIGSQPNAAQSSAYKALDTLAQGQMVIMAFEYGPTATGELDNLAQSLVLDVFKHGAHPVIVSTDYAGLLHAESLMNAFSQNPANLTALNRQAASPLLPRADYIVLRYLPAGAVGVRALAEAIYNTGSLSGTLYLSADAQGQSLPGLTADQLTSLQNAPVIVMADTSDAVRNWVEQYRPPADAATITTNPTLILATSASAAAVAQTYSAALPGTIAGPLVGLRDAIAYHLFRAGSSAGKVPAVLAQRWQSVSLGALTAGLLILLGALFGGVNLLRQRRKR